MKVAELIAYLQTQDPDLTCCVTLGDSEFLDINQKCLFESEDYEVQDKLGTRFYTDDEHQAPYRKVLVLFDSSDYEQPMLVGADPDFTEVN